MNKTALLSDCGTLRYRLTRIWLASKPRLLYVMLNPSTADHQVDDRTIKRCMHFAQAHDFGGFEVVNLFAFRTTFPKVLKQQRYPVGPENDQHILAALAECAEVCVAWGVAGAETRRPSEVLQLIYGAGREPKHLRITRTGHPEHPLYLPGDLRLQPFTLEAIDEAMHGVPA